MSITNYAKPKTYLEACKHDHWLKTMQAELVVLAANNTWKLVEKPSHLKPIGSKWVYKVKHKADGSIERHEG